jgi:putative ABC transport system permease protein
MRSLVALKILLHDRATTAGSVIGVIAIVFLVGQQLSVLFGLFNYMSVLVDHSSADVWVCTENTTNVNSSGLLPVSYLDRISALPGISWAEPLLFGSGSFKTKDGRIEAVQVVGVKNLRQAIAPWNYSQGSAASLLEYDGVTLDRLDLHMYGDPEIDDVYEINDIGVRIAGITEGVKGFAGRLVFTNIVKAREILKTPPGRCKALLVKLKNPQLIEEGIAAINKILPSAKVISASELSSKTRAYYIINTGMGGSFGFSTLVGALVGVIIITLTMYTAVLQRQKDFAVLRALGARKIDIFVIVMVQSMIIGAIGIFIGFFLLALFLHATYGSPLPSYMPRWASPILAFSTFLMCIFGSSLAMLKAIRIEPASVFR